MIHFARLYAALDGTNATSAKVDAMARYFAETPAADAAWAAYFLTGRRLTRLVPHRAIGRWTLAITGLEEWLLGECYAVVGDGAETAALVLDAIPSQPAAPLSLAEWLEQRILPLRHAVPERQQQEVLGWTRELDRWERFTLFKVLSGEFRTGVSQTLVVRALAQAASLPPEVVAARLTGDWTPSAAWYRSVVTTDVTDADRSRPYPFFLASPLDEAVRGAAALEQSVGDRQEWQVEWKWDGIRAQLIVREGHVFLWSRGEDAITERFPEVATAARDLADGTVLDGEILAFRDGAPLSFAALQQRIGRRLHVQRKARDVPVVFMAYDLLEHGGADIRMLPLSERRTRLETVVGRLPAAGPVAPVAHGRLPFDDDVPPASGVGAHDAPIQLSTALDGTWAELAALRDSSRSRSVEGLMIKRLSSPYGVGRKRGDWWKWKIAPHTVDAVLIYAQPGSGKRASLLTDYTFGLWDRGELVPVAKAYSGLTNDEIAEMDRWIRRHTVERFGPVRHVEPAHVFELGFEAIARSSRHRSGIAVRFPRMLRWRRDKTPAEADTLETLRTMIYPSSRERIRSSSR
ncbi:MAG TPA: ATP-dependent DNA ligase [Vicinamibacterales bacterium]|nr:ATP-dependent DNA ligase [Vicinamibacterales bacterium]